MTTDKLEPIRAVFRQAGLYAHAADDLLCQRLLEAATPAPEVPAADRTAIRLLVAAGFVTEEKANEALCIAHGFSTGPLAPPAKACPCGKAECVESWEPGCGLGTSKEHAVAMDETPHPAVPDHFRGVTKMAAPPAPAVPALELYDRVQLAMDLYRHAKAKFEAASWVVAWDGSVEWDDCLKMAEIAISAMLAAQAKGVES